MKEYRRLLLDTIVLGLAGAFSAQLFTWLLRIFSLIFFGWLAKYQPPGLPEEGGVLHQVVGPNGLWLIPVATTIGGLISGFIVFKWAPEAEGHGTDTVVEAFHNAAGFIRARVPGIKMVASAITIGSGGAAGREGPTALITAGIGSVYAKLMKRTDDERRLLVLIGMSAGLSAIFRSPVGTALFAIEVLYSGMEFDVGALLYTMLASIIAYAVNGFFVGWQPLFTVPDMGVPSAQEYPWYILLGITGGLVGVLLPEVFYRIRDGFRALPMPVILKPALGGLGVGLMALWLPQVLGGGYGWIQLAIDGKLAASLLFILIFAKILAFSLTVSSGGSGGIFAPSLFVGAMLGGFMASVFGLQPAAMVVVGMAAVFSGAARVPIATLLMVTEMTDGFHLLVPAALTVVLSYFVQVALSRYFRYRSMYEAQVPGRSDSPAHQVEHLESVLQLLAERRIAVPVDVSHLDLRTLLEAGIPIDLPDNKRLMMGIVKKDSIFVGQKMSMFKPDDEEEADQLEIVASFRDGHTILPQNGNIIQPGDRLLLITSSQKVAQLAPHLLPVPK